VPFFFDFSSAYPFFFLLLCPGFRGSRQYKRLIIELQENGGDTNSARTVRGGSMDEIGGHHQVQIAPLQSPLHSPLNQLTSPLTTPLPLKLPAPITNATIAPTPVPESPHAATASTLITPAVGGGTLNGDRHSPLMLNAWSSSSPPPILPRQPVSTSHVRDHSVLLGSVNHVTTSMSDVPTPIHHTNSSANGNGNGGGSSSTTNSGRTTAVVTPVLQALPIAAVRPPRPSSGAVH
jgi:hypothetical protein